MYVGRSRKRWGMHACMHGHIHEYMHVGTHSVMSRVWSVIRRARPKSVILRSQLEFTRMLEGFRSLFVVVWVEGGGAVWVRGKGYEGVRTHAQTLHSFIHSCVCGRKKVAAPVDDADGVDVLDPAEELVEEELHVLGAEGPPVVDGAVQVHVHQLPHLCW